MCPRTSRIIHHRPTTANLLPHKKGNSESQSLVEGIRGSLVLGPQTRHRRLGRRTSRLRSIIRTTDIGQLVANKVGDDVGIERVALARRGHQGRVRGEEGALGRLAVELCPAKLEVHGRGATAKVGACDRGGASGGRGGGVGCCGVGGGLGVGRGRTGAAVDGCCVCAEGQSGGEEKSLDLHLE